MAGTQVREQATTTKPAEEVSPYKAMTERLFAKYGTPIQRPERRP